ncbi:MAG: tRNA threonylcarbamoyladenosine dehydratase [Tannerella sp.]|jgi:tRNA A37 threonylcarbamoyladenosine dehydratase|nr:tRNA threonylcarbamoyladenosine dehydratase [Tannerella sp.]
MELEKGLFTRTELLLGKDIMEKIASQRVMIVGVGGVGSWCAESLVRSGFRHITLVDSDRVCITNINRQLMATTKTVGQIKVEALKTRLLEINPSVEIEAVQQIYSTETSGQFRLETCDYIIDAIDSLKDKAQLILDACRTKAVFFSSMGAALKIDPSKVQTAEFWKVKGCPLAAALRRKFKRLRTFPARKFQCVFSEELLTNRGVYPSQEEEEPCSNKAQINGTAVHITAIFGFTLAGLVMRNVCR